MDLLRRFLYWEAAFLVLGGVAFAIAPGWVVRGVFDEPPTVEAWVRVVGVQAIGFGLVSVVIAHRIEQLWWASWALVITGAGIALVALTHALIGVPRGTGSLLWGTVGLVGVVFTLGLLAGLALAGTQRDPHDEPG
jgi:hypothetical protein